MPGIRDRVAIIGMGCSKFGERWDANHVDLMIEACYEAFEDARIEPKDIQAAWLGSMLSGYSGTQLALALKTDYIPITRVENFCGTGIDTFRNASFAVAAGAYDFVLACGVDKLKDSGYSGLPLSSMEPEDSSKARPAMNAGAMFAMYAVRYFHAYGLTPEEGKKVLARIAVKSHHNGTMSPKAHFQREITMEQALRAPLIAWPLGLFDCCGVSDGAAAAIITTPELAKSFRDDYVMVKGLGISAGAKQHALQSDYDWVHWEETVRASRQAYDEAGVKEPRKEISIAQLHDCFTSTELITYEDLRFSPRGQAWKDVNAGAFDLDGDLPIQTDGGLKCFGHPIGASGLRQIYENYKQIQGRVQLPSRQLKNVGLALNHNLGGVFGQNLIGVCIIGARD